MKFKYMILMITLMLASGSAMAGLFDPPLQNASFEEESSWGAATPGWFDYDDGQAQYYAFQEGEGDLSNFPDSDGSVWGALRPGGIHWQQIGTWDANVPYRIEVLLGNRRTWENGGVIVSLWAGGTVPAEQAAGDATTATGIGATMIAESATLITDNVGSWPGSYEDESKEEVIYLNTGSDFAIGDPLWIQVVNANQAGISYFDNVRIADARLPIDPDPMDSEELIEPELDARIVSGSLSWVTDPAIDGGLYDVYFGTDANELSPDYFGNFKVVDQSSDAIYSPTIPLLDEQVYYWQVITYEPNALGGYNLFDGPVWSFTTRPPTPVITAQPISQRVDAGSVTEIVVVGSNLNEFAWQKDGEPIVDDGRILGAATGTLTINDVGIADEGLYTCLVGNDLETLETVPARLMIKRLVGLWKLDGNADDSVGDEVPGAPAFNGTLPAEPNFVEGIDGGGYEFAGDGRVIIVEGTEDYYDFYPLGLTVSAWIKTTQGGYGAYVSKQDNTDGNKGFILHHNSGEGIFVLRENFGDLTAWNATIVNDGQWHLVTGVYDPGLTRGKIYLDGMFDRQSGENTNPLTLHDAPLIFGAELVDGSVAFNGIVDDIRIYNYPLSDGEVLGIYANVAPGYEDCLAEIAGDVTGDCKVNLDDLMALAGSWLDCGYYGLCD